MRFVRKLLISISLVALAHNLVAQETAVVSIDLSRGSFEQLASAIESQSNYKFYFKNEWVDTLKITVNATNRPVRDLLDEILAGTMLEVSFDSFDVYIVPGGRIVTELRSDFFDNTPLASSNIADELNDALFNTGDTGKKNENEIRVIGGKTPGPGSTATIAGFVSEISTGEAMVGATIYTSSQSAATASDASGYYALTLPKGRHDILVKSVGMKTTTFKIILNGDGRLDMELKEEITPLKEVVVQSERDVRVSGLQLGVERIDIKTMKTMPLVLGETDIIKVVQALPGVQTVGEGTSGLNVRGGATNQNLILLNDAVIFNPAHLFGFFSAFNPDVLKSVELYKSSITADYGGRISSVMDVKSKDGNAKKFSGSGGVSPITGRLMLEGPIKSDKTSFLVAARSTYSDWLLSLIDSDELNKSTASFYDVNLSVNHKLDDKNDFHASFYASRDRFRLGNDTTYSYGDKNGSVKWKHIFNNKIYGILSGSISKYDYSISSSRDTANAFVADFSVSQANAQFDLSYFPRPGVIATAGTGVIFYGTQPGEIRPDHPSSLILPSTVQREKAREIFLYASEQIEITPRLSVSAGIRYTIYQFLGPRTSYVYNPNAPRDESAITDTIQFDRGAIATYHGPEPRVSFRYILPGNASVKLSYNRMRQYINQLTNTTAITPTDVWKLADQFIKPQIGDQVSAGFFKNTGKHRIEFSTEVYYKWLHNSIDFKNSASLIFNEVVETDLVNAKGKAYGIEVLVRKPEGKLNGWISYTYSRSFLQTKSIHTSETINNGVYYPSNQDKPHSVNFISNYKFNRRVNISFNATYSTGRPITIPIAQYYVNGSPRLFYSERNEYRIPDYFRTDVSINFEGNHKIKKLAHSSWTISVYNLTGRKNPYSIFFRSENSEIKGYKLYVFAYPIPTLTYNFKF